MESDANTSQLQASGGTGEDALTLDWEQPTPKESGDGMVGPAQPVSSLRGPTNSDGMRASSRRRTSRYETREQLDLPSEGEIGKETLTTKFSRNKK